QVINLFLEKRGDEVKITEEVVMAAAENEETGEAIMQLLLEKRGDEVKITEEVVRAAAENEETREAIMQLLLERSIVHRGMAWMALWFLTERPLDIWHLDSGAQEAGVRSGAEH